MILIMHHWQRTLYITFFAQLVSAIGLSLFFPFLPLYIEELGTNTSISLDFWSGMAYSAISFSLAVASPIWGTLSDRYGRKPMVMRSMLGGGLIILLMGFARSAEELVFLRACQGLVTGTVLATNALVAGVMPPDRRGYAMGLLHGGFLAGVAIGPMLGGTLADTIGFRKTFLLAAVILTIAGVFVTLGIKEDFVPPQRQHRRYGVFSAWWRVLTIRGVPLSYAIRFLTLLGPSMLLPILPLYVKGLLPASAQVSTVTGIVFGLSYATGTIGSFYLGRLSDRLGQQRVLVLSLLAAASFFAPQSLVADAWQLMPLQMLTGVAIGGVTPLLNALLAHYTRAGEEGMVYGLNHSISASARATGPMAGVMVGLLVGYPGVFVASGLVMLLAALLAGWYLPDIEQTGPTGQPEVA